MTEPLSSQTRRVGSLGILAALLLALALLAVRVPAAPADVIRPLVVLGPAFVANGTAIVSGQLGVPSSQVELRINGERVGVQIEGQFAAAVNLNGQSNLSFAVRHLLTGESTTINIPLTTRVVGPGGLIDPAVLSALEQAGVTVAKPLEGFRIHDGLPLRVDGSVLNSDDLASLKVNGIDILSLLATRRDFSVQLPSTTREVMITAVDQRGVSQTTVLPDEHATSSATAPTAGRSVHASRAVGVRIARVRYDVRGIRRTKRLRVVVTVKDRRGLLVHNAAVGVRSVRARWIARNPKAKRSNQLGRASFVLEARNRSFGRRLRLVVVAKTPHAKVRKASSVRLPRLARSAASRSK